MDLAHFDMVQLSNSTIINSGFFPHDGLFEAVAFPLLPQEKEYLQFAGKLHHFISAIIEMEAWRQARCFQASGCICNFC